MYSLKYIYMKLNVYRVFSIIKTIMNLLLWILKIYKFLLFVKPGLEGLCGARV